MLERRQQAIPVAHERRRSDRDRRASQRCAADGAAAVFTRREGDEYRAVAADLRDISQGGASALVRSPPPSGVPLWFRLHGDDTSAWIGVTIVGVSRTGWLGTGPHLVRVRFHEPCPYELFKSAIEGFCTGRGDPELARGGLRDRDGFR